MPDWSVTRSARRPVMALLALSALALAAPLAADLLNLATASEWQLAAPSPPMAWAGALLGLVVGLLVALAAWPGRAVRRGALLGAALAVLLAGSAIAWPQISGSLAPLPACSAEPAVGQLVVSRAASYLDGRPREGSAGRLFEPFRGNLARLFAELRPVAVEDLGGERLELGQRSTLARHCRALVSGSQVTAALPQLTSDALAGRPLVPAELPVWRGDFDWWVSADGGLAAARFRVGGHPSDAWPEADGNQGLLVVALTSSAMMQP